MTTQSNITDLVPSEQIEEFIEAANLAPPTALAMAWSAPVKKGSGNNVQMPRFDNLTVPAGAKAENVDFALVASTTSASNLSGGWVGHSDQVSWEADYHSLVDAVGAVIGNGVAHLRDRVDADGLAALAAFATDANYTGVALTDDRVISAIAIFNAQNPNKSTLGRGIVINTIQIRDWSLDLNGGGAGAQIGGDAESARVAELLGQREGYVGVRHGFQVFSSSNVSISTGDANGAMMQIGKGGPLVYRSWAPIGFESEWQPRGKRWETTVAAYYGWGIANNANGIGLISDGA